MSEIVNPLTQSQIDTVRAALEVMRDASRKLVAAAKEILGTETFEGKEVIKFPDGLRNDHPRKVLYHLAADASTAVWAMNEGGYYPTTVDEMLKDFSKTDLPNGGVM